MPSPNAKLTRSYRQDLRLIGSGWSRLGLVALLVGYVVLPQMLVSDFWLSILVYAGIAAIAAVGLNLLTGYAGQVSLGHAFFIGAGAYTAAEVGGDLGLPLPVWLVCAGLCGGALGALIGPFALRLRGNYLAIVTLALVFIGEHVFRNLDGLTGGNSGRGVTAPASLFGVDARELRVGGEVFSASQGYFWLVWGVLLLVMLIVKNIVRTRPGRALQAVRDRDVAAEVIGVEAGRYKVAAFAVSSAIAGVAGALLGSYQQFVSPEEFGLFVSIEYIAIVIVGGMGTVFGSVLGALFITALPRLVERYSDKLPGVATDVSDGGVISVFALNQALFGLLIVLFLIFEPRGLAAVWLRAKAYFKSWPFSY